MSVDRAIESTRSYLIAALGLLGACGGRATLVGNTEAGTTVGAGVAGSCSRFPCRNPVPILMGNFDTGIDVCDDGSQRRRAVVDCPSTIPRATVQCPSYPVPQGECRVDQDCTARPHGFCDSCACAYGCRTDADCDPGNVCQCSDPVGICVVASCSTSASCSPGCDCASAAVSGFTCQSPADQCLQAADCPSSPCGSVCAGKDPDGGGPLTCLASQCGVLGRPFLVLGAERMAAPVTGTGWHDPEGTPGPTDCPPRAKARLAAHWTRVALMEHASIAAFARFTLHLLAIGAPQRLVALSQEATGDEAEHARLAFTLASGYAGSAIGPGPLSLEGALHGFSLEAFVECLVREGCVGETMAAIEAQAAVELVRDPVVRHALETIARDELRHAELAWRTLAWLLAEGRIGHSEVRGLLSAAIGEPLRTSGQTDVDEDLSSHGVIGDRTRSELRQSAMRDVVAACGDALLAGRVGPPITPQPPPAETAPSTPR